MPSYREIEDVHHLAKLSEQLTRLLRQQLRHSRRRTVGFPGGRGEVVAHFGGAAGADQLWWVNEKSANGQAYQNLLGRGDPDAASDLMIDLQFNVPIKVFDRRHGGAFVEDIESGAIVLAHRGIVTRGNARVSKALLRREMAMKMVSVATSHKPIELFLVASLDSGALVEDMAAFARELRRSIAATGQDSPSLALARSQGAALDQLLGKYFDEFCGKRALPARQAVVVEVRHGGVVRQLKAAVAHMGESLKSQQVDLAIRSRGTIFLFEVKTDMTSTSLYTALGQLALHAVTAAEQFPKLSVRKILVTPKEPSLATRRRVEEVLGVELMTFEWTSGARVAFEPKRLAALLA